MKKRYRLQTLRSPIKSLPTRVATLRAPKTDESLFNKATWRGKQGIRTRRMRAQPLCQACEFLGIVTAAVDCDHWIPRAQGGAELDWNNLVNLCAEHHSQKTAAEQSGRPPPFEIVPIVPEPRPVIA